MQVYVWPDGSYHSIEDEGIEPPSWKSDDYIVVDVPDDVEDIDQWVYELTFSVYLGDNLESRTKVQ